ncbi:hypothetical protein DFH08DRAFT_139464 [Mycena albidolilacea]|uniref:Uncharacterized protein n=1 Tax=Mycena albidolilacea TaxID=1033008 RepID=A0AAD7A4B6_9AGAR|nr:hypothetical protein DFH08DRAFT_139464 [Mycena albidolilacea]
MLCAYNIFQMGDIVAIEKLLNIKGHNRFCPRCSCNIKGVRNITAGTTIYHVPLTLPMKDGEPKKSWDPFNLPLRTHESFAEVTEDMDCSETVTHRKELTKFHGIKGLPALRRVGSLHFGRSTPWDFMHLAFENIGPNLVKLWSGKYKGLGAGSEDYEIEEEVWNEIWAEMAAATHDIPAQFVHVLSNTPGYFTAEAWCFWFIYLAPILLFGQIPRQQVLHPHLPVFRNHKIVNIVDWVQKYEEYYYQYREDHLSACPLTIHGLLHVPDDIRFCGPEWSTWTHWGQCTI